METTKTIRKNKIINKKGQPIKTKAFKNTQKEN